MNPRDVLNRIKWTGSEELEDAVIYYIHRGAPDGIRRVKGEDIVKIGRNYMELENASIPYHRIIKISHRGEILYERRSG